MIPAEGDAANERGRYGKLLDLADQLDLGDGADQDVALNIRMAVVAAEDLPREEMIARYEEIAAAEGAKSVQRREER